MFVWKDENKRKKAGNGPFLKRRKESYWIQTEDQPYSDTSTPYVGTSLHMDF